MPSVLSSKYDYNGCTASGDEFNMGTYRVRFIITTDGLLGPKAVLSGALALSAGSNDVPPNLWATYAFQGDVDIYSYAREFTIEKDSRSNKLYYITATYLPCPPGEGPRLSIANTPVNSVTNPVGRAPIVWWDREVFSLPVMFDKDGKKVVNKCKDYYPEDDEIESSRGVLVIEQNVATLDEVIFYSRTFDQRVNASAWSVVGSNYVVPARCALVREVSSGPMQTEQGYNYFHVVFRFSLNFDTWDLKKAEYGQFHYTKTAGGSYETVTTGNVTRLAFTDAQALVKLDEDGTRRDDSQPAIITSWKVRKEADFGELPF